MKGTGCGRRRERDQHTTLNFTRIAVHAAIPNEPSHSTEHIPWTDTAGTGSPRKALAPGYPGKISIPKHQP